MTSVFNSSLSGLQVAQKVMNAISHNVSNAETPGYRRLTENNSERGPFPVITGVSTTISRVESDLLDDRLQSAAMDRVAADIDAAALDELQKMPFGSLATSYSEMMDSTHQLLRTPSDPIAQQNFNSRAAAFDESTESFKKRLESIKGYTSLNMEFTNERINRLQEQLQRMSGSGVGTPEEIADLKSALLMASKTLDAYQRVLSDIIPPVELAFTRNVEGVHTSMNSLSGQEIFADDGFNSVVDFSTFSEESLPEWDNHSFNTEIGRIQNKLGIESQLSDSNLRNMTSVLEDLQAQAKEMYGVDLVEERVKALRYQTMYEANAQMIRTQDDMLGTLLSIRG